MNGTTWTATGTPVASRRGSAAAPAVWHRRVLRPLHRLLDTALRARELEGLDPATLTDIGYRRG